MPTLLVITASLAGPAAPQKLAYQEIARSAVDTERPETGPGVERAHIRPLALLSFPPIRVMALAALCSAHILRVKCTMAHKRKIFASPGAHHNPNKSLLLRRNWLRSAKPRACCPNLCISQTPHGRKPNRPPKIPILRPNRQFVFSAVPQHRLMHQDAQTQNRCHLPLPG